MKGANISATEIRIAFGMRSDEIARDCKILPRNPKKIHNQFFCDANFEFLFLFREITLSSYELRSRIEDVAPDRVV